MTKQIFLIATIIRLLLIPWFYHPDLKSQYFHFQFLSQGVANIYQHIAENKSRLPYTDTFNYLPLTYFTFGSYYALAKLFTPPTLGRWLNDWGPNQNLYTDFPIFLFILKLPYLIFDLLIAYFLFRITSNKLLLKLWLFNPLTLYLVYILGNFDVLPSLLTLLSLYLLPTNSKFSGLSFGLATCLKAYSLLFLPVFLVKIFPNKSKIFSFLLFFSLPLLGTIGPFLPSQDFVKSFLSSGLTQKIIESKINNIPIFPVIYGFIFFATIKKNVAYSLSLIGLAFLILVKFHPQWIIWFFPYFLLSFCRPLPHFLFAATIFLFLCWVALINDHYLTWGHLLPLDPDFLHLTVPHDFIKFRFLTSPSIVQDQLKFIATVVSLVLVLISWKDEKNNS